MEYQLAYFYLMKHAEIARAHDQTLETVDEKKLLYLANWHDLDKHVYTRHIPSHFATRIYAWKHDQT